jgi:hypothetical protein
MLKDVFENRFFFFLKLKIFIIMRRSSYQSTKFYWTYWQTVRLPWTSWTLFFENIVNENHFSMNQAPQEN